MQNYLRKQFNGTEKRIKQVNVITLLSDLLHQYKELVSDKNIVLGNQIFELLIEMI